MWRAIGSVDVIPSTSIKNLNICLVTVGVWGVVPMARMLQVGRDRCCGGRASLQPNRRQSAQFQQPDTYTSDMLICRANLAPRVLEIVKVMSTALEDRL
jgi:hypothetical protein